MVGVASSNLVAPTKFGRKNKHLAETLGAFFYVAPFTATAIGGGATTTDTSIATEHGAL